MMAVKARKKVRTKRRSICWSSHCSNGPRTGTLIEGLPVSLGKWAMAGYLAATGAAPEDQGELALLIGTTESMARRIMDTAAQACPEGQDPVPALVRVIARRPQDGEADAAPQDLQGETGADVDTAPQEPQGETGAAPAAPAEKEAQEDGPGAGPQNGAGPDGSGGKRRGARRFWGKGGAGQPEKGQPASGADILSPDG